jgi:hypothetical protein
MSMTKSENAVTGQKRDDENEYVGGIVDGIHGQDHTTWRLYQRRYSFDCRTLRLDLKVAPDAAEPFDRLANLTFAFARDAEDPRLTF